MGRFFVVLYPTRYPYDTGREVEWGVMWANRHLGGRPNLLRQGERKDALSTAVMVIRRL